MCFNALETCLYKLESNFEALRMSTTPSILKTKTPHKS